MGLRSQLAVTVGKTSQWVLKTFLRRIKSAWENSIKNRSAYFRSSSKRLSSCRYHWYERKNLDYCTDGEYFTARI